MAFLAILTLSRLRGPVPADAPDPLAAVSRSGVVDSPGPTVQPTNSVDAGTQPRTAPGQPVASRLKILIPAYIYPTGDGRKEWQRLIDAASKVEIIAIANPDSGPGAERNPDYASVFTDAVAQGVTLVGYVSTDYGRRDLTRIKSEIDDWIRLYPEIRGFFFDQQPSDRKSVSMFSELNHYAKQKLMNPLVITNPGTPCDEAYLAQAVSNVTCVFLNFVGFAEFELPPALSPYDASRFAAFPYNIPDVETMRAVVKEAIVKRIGFLYVSDAKPPTEWAKLPDYWEAEVEAISQFR